MRRCSSRRGALTSCSGNPSMRSAGRAACRLPGGPPVRPDLDRRKASGHAVGIEEATEVVDFVGGEPGQTVRKFGDGVLAVEVLVLDVEGDRAGDQTADVIEAEAALVVFGDLCGLGDDPRGEQGVALAVRDVDDRGGAGDAELWCGQAQPRGAVVQGGELVERGGELCEESGGFGGLPGQVERCRGLLEDRSAGLRDAERARDLAQGLGWHGASTVVSAAAKRPRVCGQRCCCRMVVPRPAGPPDRGRPPSSAGGQLAERSRNAACHVVASHGCGRGGAGTDLTVEHFLHWYSYLPSARSSADGEHTIWPIRGLTWADVNDGVGGRVTTGRCRRGGVSPGRWRGCSRRTGVVRVGRGR